ncbi:transcriptional regulator, GntR family [Yoonia tamlensis]|uniref:Transcriptional regulator, GntR family n=1 Tax=Yoonia tamlensis TaxID=390270 RepID=A0A1I6I034_9RHOB|nr:GntR family transcriptional regulator [Yoonia tamlensis]SFR60076.1 transcriptional regulator, GntR family [Yoonia tamlensis]
MSMIDGTRVKETSATHGAYVTLREMILTGALPAGEKLKIEQLRGLLNTGASPVREALSLLTSDMLVERIDQRGFRAAPASKANFEEILALRCTLEDLALRQSIQNASPAWEEKLVLAHHHMKKASGQGTKLFEEAHKKFHMALLANSHSPILERLCAQLYDLNIRYRYLAAKSNTYQKRDVSAEHEEILEAAIQRDQDRASARLLSHYRLTGEYLTRELDI